jgi:hypothetical protein
MKNQKLIFEETNGKLTNLTPLSSNSNHKLNPEAAAAYDKMVKAAKEDGVTWSITDSYRPFEIQDKIFDWDYYKKTKKRRKKGTAGTPVAYPGTSNHGWGAALDLVVKYGDKAHKWLTDNASKFGFSNPFSNPRTEPWHWEHVESAKKLGSGKPMTPENDKTDSDSETTTDTETKSSETKTDEPEGEKSMGNPIFKSMLNLLGFNENDGSLENVQTITEEITRIKKLMK